MLDLRFAGNVAANLKPFFLALFGVDADRESDVLGDQTTPHRLGKDRFDDPQHFAGERPRHAPEQSVAPAFEQRRRQLRQLYETKLTLRQVETHDPS